jgi:anti-anti-sigma regulatory factor
MLDTSTTGGRGAADPERVALGALCTLREALPLKAQLEDGLALARDIELDGAGVERIDCAGLQLLVAFVRELDARRLAVRWSGTSPVLQRAARQVGLEAALALPVAQP